MFTDALASIRIFTISTLPSQLAWIRAVSPNYSTKHANIKHTVSVVKSNGYSTFSWTVEYLASAKNRWYEKWKHVKRCTWIEDYGSLWLLDSHSLAFQTGALGFIFIVFVWYYSIQVLLKPIRAFVVASHFLYKGNLCEMSISTHWRDSSIIQHLNCQDLQKNMSTLQKHLTTNIWPTPLFVKIFWVLISWKLHPPSILLLRYVEQ